MHHGFRLNHMYPHVDTKHYNSIGLGVVGSTLVTHMVQYVTCKFGNKFHAFKYIPSDLRVHILSYIGFEHVQITPTSNPRFTKLVGGWPTTGQRVLRERRCCQTTSGLGSFVWESSPKSRNPN